MFRLILLFWVFYLGHPVGVMWAQGSIFEKITIEQGLSQGMIFDILQTRDGFLWVATKDGLNRYDGYNFKVFANNPFDPFSIAENNVTALFEDARGLLWVGLQRKGIDVFDPKTGRFYHFSIDFGENVVPEATLITDIIEIPATGVVWIVSNTGGLFHVAMPADWKDRLPDLPNLGTMQPAVKVSLPVVGEGNKRPEKFRNLIFYNDTLWVCSERTVYALDPRTNTVRRVKRFGEGEGARMVWAPSGQGGVWWTTNYWPTAPKTTLERWGSNGQRRVFSVPPPLTQPWNRLFPGESGHVWLVLGGMVWDLAPDETPDFSKPDQVFDQHLTAWAKDRNNNFWVGTDGYGLRKVNPMHGRFHAGASGWSLRGVWANRGRYFARYLNSIAAFDPITGVLSKSAAFRGGPEMQFNLLFDSLGTTWLLGSEHETPPKLSLYRYAPDGGPVPTSYALHVKSNFQDPMCLARDGGLWIAADRGQLVRFDPVSERIEYFDFGHLFGKKINAIGAAAIAEDSKGHLWIGTQLGLVKGDRNAQGFDFELIKASSDKPTGLNNNTIACILPVSSEGGEEIWLGTKGGGINIMDPTTGQCRHITSQNGLLNNVVYGILPGNSPPSGGAGGGGGGGGGGEFWCSTNRGIAKLVRTAKTGGEFVVTTYTSSLGLQDNEFNSGAFWKSDRGELLFGGINGLNRFWPDELRPDTVPPPVYIVGIEINHEKSRWEMPVEHLKVLELAYDQNNVSFEFAALDFADPSKNRYRYRLVGLDNDWAEIGNGRFAHFNHLAPGRYELRVQANNGESAWREASPLVVDVSPPWYRSWLAYLCYVLLLVYGTWRAYRFQIRRVKEREQQAFEHRETERVKALEQMKTNFFSNVTHEFRTPLTLISEPVRQLLANPKDPALPEKLKLVDRNSQRLLQLVNQLLDLAKLESGSMALDLRRGDLAQTVREVFETFLPLAEKRGVKLTLKNEARDALLPFEFDAGKAALVLNNLISNALKFTPQGGRVEVSVSRVSNPADVGSIEIRVSDTGIGIAPEHLDKIFDRFYQVDGSHTRVGEGTGIGLALSKELAELMGGGIAVESEVGKGTTFTFIMPVRFTIDDLRLTMVQDSLTAEAGKKPKPDPSRVIDRNPKWIVLVIEDNPDLRYFIKTSIGIGWQVVEASNGEEGIQKALELLPDLVVSDLMMPGKDGYAVCAELKNHELTAHIPVILLTAKSATESKIKGLGLGADDYLTKPFSTEELLARMANLVETRRRLRALFAQQNATLARADAQENLPAFLSAPDRDFLQKFMLLLEQYLADERLGVEDFAQKMLLSRSQLHRKLTALTDKNATDFIRDYRLDRAHAMLKNREGMVGEIALRVGFGSEKYFSTAFKEKFGVPPSQV